MWRTAKLGDVCKIVNGGTPKSDERNFWDGDIKWLTPKDMGKLQGKYVGNTERRITADGLANSSAKLVPANSVILSCRAPIGHVFINDCEMSFNQGCKGLIPSKDLLVEYLYYFLFASKKLLNDLGTGTTFKEISGKTLANVAILLPPLAEQQRIVAKLDAAFAEIDRAIEIAEAKEAEIDKLKASLISSLLTGEEMTASTLGETCRMYQPKTISAKDMVANGDYVVFGANGIIGRYDKYNHEHEQLLVTCRGATCGSVNISQPKSWITGNAMVIQPDLAKVSMRYMEYLFRGGIDLSKAITGSAQPQITRKSLEPIKFSYPSLKEQERIVETLDVASQELNVSMKHTKSILANYNSLKAAILAQELQPSEAA